jgi:uncharacterized protein (TIGR03382 family)
MLKRITLLPGFVLLSMAACVTQPSSTTSDDEDTSPVSGNHEICSGGRVQCRAKRSKRAMFNSQRKKTGAPGPTQSFYTPTDLQAAYRIDPTWNTGATIALVDAYGYSTLEADLGMYRSMYGLPACTIASGCLKIVNSSGQTSPLPSDPPGDDDWTVETALDVDMASAACPNCKILVVQATDDSGDGLDQANATAASLGATVISNSWGGPYSSGDATYETTDFNQPGHAIFVAAGDNGYDDGGQGADYPSTSAHTIAVGGTNLAKDSSTRGWTETVWGAAQSTQDGAGGSSCNTKITKPSWQSNVSTTTCKGRAADDTAAVGDPETGVVIYDNSGIVEMEDGQSFTDNGEIDGIGGTSAASPLVAGIFAATGNGSASAALIYSNTSLFYDVTSGTNEAGTSCSSAPLLCNAGSGWDGPSGWGTPNAAGLAALNGVQGTGSGSGSNEGSGSNQGSDGTGSDGNGSGSGSGDDGNGDNGDGNGNSGGGGCSAAGGAGGATFLFALGLAVVRRRRRA